MNTVARPKDKSGVGEFFRWRPAAWLRVTGEDAAGFLQGQFTNDLRPLAASGAVYGLWLNQKGRVLADSFIVAESEGGFWIASYFSPAAVIRERLESYIVADDVAVEDLTAGWSGMTVFPAGAPLPEEIMPPGIVRWPGRRGQEPAEEWVFPDGSLASDAFAGLAELTAAEMERRRIAARIPAVPRDIGPGELPNEGGLDVSAISHTKGCYLGQEVIARLRSMGQVRRRLFAVRGIGAIPPLPAALFQGGRKVGELRSAAIDGDGFTGLALLTLLNLRRETALGFGPDGGGPPTIELIDPS